MHAAVAVANAEDVLCEGGGVSAVRDVGRLLVVQPACRWEVDQHVLQAGAPVSLHGQREQSL